ncbi:C40 family peptidase [Gammaproteobacteria bacterium]|nr:C40 family peptidase [Gammaproteobacteria bacterium]
MDWVGQVLNKPWEWGAKGPDSFDCYGLLYWVKKNFYGQEIPHLDGIGSLNKFGIRELASIFGSNMDVWEELEYPIDGCAVALSQLRVGVHHCGVWTSIDGGLVIHAEETNRVRAQTIQNLRLHTWRTISFYELKKDGKNNIPI